MDITTIQKNINVSPRKMRLVADMVRNIAPYKALEVLKFTPQAACVPLSKAITTVLANAKAQNLDPEILIFKKLEINEGLKMKRFRAGTRGRAKPYQKRTSQIKIVLSEKGENGSKS